MCKLFDFKLHCGHRKLWWRPCKDSTSRNRRLNEPCQAEIMNNPDYPVTDEHKLNCCSVECCQIELDQKHQQLLDIEMTSLVDVDEPGKPIDETSAATRKTIKYTARRRLKQAAKKHFSRCLDCYNVEGGSYIISNADRLRLKESLYDPNVLRMINHICLAKMETTILDAISAWEKYPLVLRDKQYFVQRNSLERSISDPWIHSLPTQPVVELSRDGLFGSRTIKPPTIPMQKEILSEGELQAIYDSFEDLLSRPIDLSQITPYFDKLLKVQNHFHLLQPVGTNENFYPIAYAMQWHALKLFQEQLSKLVSWIEAQQDLGKLRGRTFQAWWYILDHIQRNVIDVSLQQMDVFSKVRKPDIRDQVKELQGNLNFYEAERRKFYKEQRMHVKELYESGQSPTAPVSTTSSSSASESNSGGLSTSVAGPPSTYVPHNFGTPLHEEPKQMQQDGDGRLAGKRSRGQHRKEGESVESSMSSISLSDKLSSRKQRKGEANGESKGEGKGKRKR